MRGDILLKARLENKNIMTTTRRGAFGRPIVEKEDLNPLEQNSSDQKPTIKIPTEKKKKFFIFKLVNEETISKPVDSKSGELVGEPYPALYIAPNAGVAVNPESGETERWRYLHGYNSIWEKDQQKPAPDKQRLLNFDGKNDIVFRTGKLKVMANNTALLQALMVQDIFAGIGDKQIIPVPFKYMLVDADKEQIMIRNQADRAFEAEVAARNADTQEMFAIAMALGIDVQNGEEDEDSIRTKFILKAKAVPELFLRVLNDPKNKVKYLVTKYMQSGDLVINEGVVSYQGKPYITVRADQDVAIQIANMTMEKDKKAMELFDTLKSL